MNFCSRFLSYITPLYGIYNYNSLNDSKIKKLVDLTKKKYISYWNQTLQNSRKLSFYHPIKNNYSPSAYLYSTRKNALRKTLVKLRTGSLRFYDGDGYNNGAKQ